MEEFQSTGRMDIENSLSKEHLRISRIISITMVIGVLFLFFIILYFYSASENQVDTLPKTDDVAFFSNIILIITIVDYIIFLIFPRFFLTRKNIQNRLVQLAFDKNNKKTENPVIKLIIFDRIYMIIRLAMLEGVALFGMVVLYLSVTNGELFFRPLLWLWVIPGIILVFFIFQNYLFKESYVDRIENQILARLKEL